MEIYDVDSDGKLTEKEILSQIKDIPDAANKAKALFAELEKNHPDKKPGDGIIDINEVAEKEIEFLKKAFPEDIKAINASMIKENKGKNLTPLQTLNIITKELQK